MGAALVGLASFHCRYHVQYRARHGSHWSATYKAADLKPYLDVATHWIADRRTDTFIAHSPIVFAKAMMSLPSHGHLESKARLNTASSGFFKAETMFSATLSISFCPQNGCVTS